MTESGLGVFSVKIRIEKTRFFAGCDFWCVKNEQVTCFSPIQLWGMAGSLLMQMESLPVTIKAKNDADGILNTTTDLIKIVSKLEQKMDKRFDQQDKRFDQMQAEQAEFRQETRERFDCLQKETNERFNQLELLIRQALSPQ